MNIIDALGYPINLQDTIVYTPTASNFLTKGVVIEQRSKNFVKVSVATSTVPRIVTIHRLSVAVVDAQLNYNKSNYPENQL